MLFREWLEKPVTVANSPTTIFINKDSNPLNICNIDLDNVNDSKQSENTNATCTGEFSLNEIGEMRSNQVSDYNTDNDLSENPNSGKFSLLDEDVIQSSIPEISVSPVKYCNLKEKPRKKFACNACDRIFLKKYSLKQHTLVVHDNFNEHKCTICSKIFRWPGNLQTHLKDHMKPKAPNVINFNNLGFISLTENTAVTLGKTTNFQKGYALFENNYECQTCHKNCSNKLGLEAHYLSHKKRKVFKCDQCVKTFSHRQSLYEHKTTHSSIKHKCDLCTQTFTLKRSVHKHKLVVHDKENRNILGMP